MYVSSKPHFYVDNKSCNSLFTDMGLDMNLCIHATPTDRLERMIAESGDYYPKSIRHEKSSGDKTSFGNDTLSVHILAMMVKVAYWRNAHDIHSWFVGKCTHLEPGSSYFVLRSDLEGLLEACQDEMVERDTNGEIADGTFGRTDDWTLCYTCHTLQDVLTDYPEEQYFYYYGGY